MESTNTTLIELGEKGASEGTIVIADRQTGGRGRLDRTWISPAGTNLYISILFRPELAASDAALFTLIASIVLNKVIEKSGVSEAKIKWPNDIQIQGKKVAGVLTEIRTKREMVDFIVLGIGVNINMTRENMDKEMGKVAHIATSLKENLGKEINRSKFAADLLLELETWYQIFINNGKAKVLTQWTSAWGDLNKRVQVRIQDQEPYEGAAIGVDERGYLMVKTDDGEINKIIAGDVVVL
ncbi:MAG: biotin--[acetyl-CoA-carboxylase] ligase [Thermodesulfobacteriota bacterium]|nr:MAG: biotin--[acetyl-CoA-carboxylase] ligase [Thermodesulfobacteriota bacterium]